MDTLASLWQGFQIAFLPTNLALCFMGALLGTLIGVLPGIGPVATISILIPITMEAPVSAIIMLRGDLLRSHVRWFHHLHSRESSRRSRIRGYVL